MAGGNLKKTVRNLPQAGRKAIAVGVAQALACGALLLAVPVLQAEEANKPAFVNPFKSEAKIQQSGPAGAPSLLQAATAAKNAAAGTPAPAAEQAAPAAPAVQPANVAAPAASDNKFVENALPGKIRRPDLSAEAMQGTLLKFDNADIFEVLQAIMGDMLHLNYIVDPSVQGKVTINTQGAVSHADVFNLLESILALNGLSIIRDGKLYKVIKDGNAPRDTLSFEANGEGSPMIHIIRVKYVQPSGLINVLKNFVGAQAGIVNDPTNKYLIVADRASNIAKILELMKVLDVNYLQEVKIKVVQVDKGDATELAKEMETLFKASGMFNVPGTEPNKVFFMPIKRMNAILIAASGEAMLDAAEKWLHTLDDVPTDGVGSNIHVHSVENTTALHVANIIRQIYGGSPIAAATAPSKTIVQGSVPTSGAMSTAAGLSGSVQIIPDEATNNIIIKANPQDYLQIKKIIQRIDLVPRQVLIQVMVAEVGLNDKTRYGVEWWLQNEKLSFKGVSYSPQTGLKSGLLAPTAGLGNDKTASGLTYMVFNGNSSVVAMFQALGETTDLNILSAPHVMASDGKEAKIEVGKDVPTVSNTIATPAATTGTTTGGFNTSNTISYRTVGILLNVKPHVNASGLVNLVLTQEVSSVADESVAGVNSPVFSKRKVETEITLEEGKTLLIAGLIENKNNKTNTGVPGFKDIPLLGSLFGVKGDKLEKTELMVTITPYVVRNRDEGDRITAGFQENLSSLKNFMKNVERPDLKKVPAPKQDKPKAEPKLDQETS